MPRSLSKLFLFFALKQPLAFIIFFISPISIVLKANVIPYVLKIIIDTITIHQQDRGNIFILLQDSILLGAVSWFGLIFIERFQYWIQSIAIPKFEADMRMSILEHSLNHSYEYFYNQFAGNMVSKIMSLIKAIDTIRKTLSWNVITAFSVIAVAVVLLYTVAPIFSLIIGTWVIFQSTITLYFVKHVNYASNINAKDKNVISGLIVDTISNMVSVKLFARESYELSYIRKAQATEKESNARLIATMNKFCLFMDCCVTIVLCITIYLLIKRWQSNILTPGDIIFVFYTIFAIMNQMWQLGYSLADLFREIGIAQQALKTITQAHQVTDIPNAQPLKVRYGRIEFKNASFSYSKGQKLFQNIDLTIESRQKVGIIGYSGSGKSSFISLILRLYDLESGAILIDGQDISKVQQATVRNSISAILQDTILFHRTLLENIRYGKINATEKEVVDASKTAHCHEFIKRMPEGYNTLVGERGVKLSGGQRQRISIARAILKNSPIIILDEATSALDSITERLIQEGLDKLMQDRTVIIIAHRLSTLLKMDRILVFDKGQIVEDGKHDKLLKAEGYYAAMWQRQVDGFLIDKEV